MSTELLEERQAQKGDDSSSSFKRILDNFFDSQKPRFCPTERAWTPPTDVFETQTAIHIKMELAGIHIESVDVKVSDNFLVVRGRRDDEQHVKRDNFHLMEIHYGQFERVFGLPNHMEIKNVTAELKNGFLLITVPKDMRVRDYKIKVD
ncbi:MAG: Hsp20/alpha crystallin family protein [Candidatus Sumerlaeaceae bacterium]|nr:Hsp20/alpha crystallin family protein [Candidatus Sumerlaeaceae bacterium]